VARMVRPLEGAAIIVEVLSRSSTLAVRDPRTRHPKMKVSVRLMEAMKTIHGVAYMMGSSRSTLKTIHGR